MTNHDSETTKKGRPCVYILRCKDGSLYTGWTNDFEKRLEAHNCGKGAKYTRGRGPLTPVYLEYFEDKVSATKREAAIKKLPLKKKQLLLSSDSNVLHSQCKPSI
ncbi:MAG: GIY-YIG nuclease family protein [Bacillota bacterium]|nr:GIY-YIG nuclease family protein [Bacillota bacterium]